MWKGMLPWDPPRHRGLEGCADGIIGSFLWQEGAKLVLLPEVLFPSINAQITGLTQHIPDTEPGKLLGLQGEGRMPSTGHTELGILEFYPKAK